MKCFLFGVLTILLGAELAFSKSKHVSIRHLSDNLFESAPGIEDYQSFRSELDLDDDWEDLEEEFQERSESLEELEKIPLKSLSIGKQFSIHKKMLALIEKQITYLIFKRDVLFMKHYQQWLIELKEDKPRLYNKNLEQLKLKGLEIARTMTATYKKLDPEFTQFALVKFYILNQNQNYSYYFKKFSKNYPKSKKMADMHHLAGEGQFQAQNYQQAANHFQSAFAVKDSPIRPLSSFKLAWSQILLSQKTKSKKEKEKSLKKADAALRLSIKLMKDGGDCKNHYPLKKIAGRDLSWFWAYTAKPAQRVRKFFKESDLPDQFNEYLYYSAIEASNKKNLKLMNETFAKLFEESKEKKALPHYLAKAIELNMQAGKLSALAGLFDKFHKVIDKESDWYDEWEDDKYFIKMTEEQLAYNLKTSSIDLNRKAIGFLEAANKIKSNEERQAKIILSKKYLKTSTKLYQRYYNWYPDRKEFDDIAFNLGNILLEQEAFREAIDVFQVVAKKKKSHQALSAAYNAVIAAYTLVQQSPSPRLPEPGKAKKPIAIPDTHLLLISQIDSFINRFPKAKEAVSSQYTAGQILFDFGHYQKAFKRFKALAIKSPRTAEGENAMRAILSFYWERQQWDKVVKIANQLIIEPNVIEAGHEKFLEETLGYAKSQIAMSKK